MLALDKIDPQFRKITDQLFFTDRMDLDLSDYSSLLGNKDDHFHYLWDRLARSLEIFWNEQFWINRFELLLKLNPRKIIVEIETLINNKFKNLLFTQVFPNPSYHNQYIHMIAWAKAKCNVKENIMSIKDFLLSLPSFLTVDGIINTIKNFIPFIFKDMNEYISCIFKNINQSARTFEVIKQFEDKGFFVDREPVYKLAKDLLFKRVPNRKNRNSFFTMLADPQVLNNLKSNYEVTHKGRLLDIIKKCDFKEIEDFHLRNFKNLLELDASIGDELVIIYADKLYARSYGFGHKKLNIQRLIRVCKTFSQISNKKILAYLSTNNRMSDIKHWISAFPDLTKLSAFV